MLTFQDKPQEHHLRFVFVTDLHNISFGENNEQLVLAVKNMNPDAVLFGGDLVLGKPGESFADAMSFVKRVAELYPTFYANGNHEQRLRLYPETYGTMYEAFRRELAATKAVYLVNESAAMTLKGIPVCIHGFEAKREYYKRLQGRRFRMPLSELEAVFQKPDKGQYHILLAHNPAFTETYLDWGADLTFCGHFHGGVVRLGKHHGLIDPNLNLFSKYCYGMFEREDRRVIVSSGLGEHTVPFRIHNPYEIVVTDVHFREK